MADMGRPPLWKTNDELVQAISGYWKYCEDNKEIPDVESLADYLDTTRVTLLDYEKKEDFSYTIKKAKTKIAKIKKQMAMKGIIPAAIFCFDFKNNHDYTDKQEIESKNININKEINDMSLEEIEAELEKIENLEKTKSNK